MGVGSSHHGYGKDKPSNKIIKIAEIIRQIYDRCVLAKGNQEIIPLVKEREGEIILRSRKGRLNEASFSRQGSRPTVTRHTPAPLHSLV